MSPPPAIDLDLECLGFDRGAHVLVVRALSSLPPGGRLRVIGSDPALSVHLRAWTRSEGHGFEADAGAGPVVGVVVRGTAETDRWSGAVRAGGNGSAGGVAPQADASWGLAARGALVEAGGPAPRFDLQTRDAVWADAAPRLYAQAVASQWDPNTAIDWDEPFDLPDGVEDAVVQLMTYLVENEQAALTVPARFLGRLHPHYREIVQLLAVQVADEARHIEVFTRRALLRRDQPGQSGAGGRWSLQTLLDEPDFTQAGFLLSVLGEATFLSLLSFLERHAPDPITRRISQLALQDEARHVAFGIAHIEHAVRADPALLGNLRASIERRHAALKNTAGLNQGVFDALVVLAAGAWTPAAIAAGYGRVLELQADMNDSRRRRLVRIGFAPEVAAELSALHTRNFM
jgi:hypothetical protein